MNTRVRKILENWITDTTTADNVAKEIVSAAHRRTYREIMDFVRYMQMRGNTCSKLSHYFQYMLDKFITISLRVEDVNTINDIKLDNVHLRHELRNSRQCASRKF
jgi:hypothetical protein